MSLKSKILDDTKLAMKAKDKQKVGALRLLSASIKQIEVDERKELSDDDIVAVVTKMVKQRKDSAEQYKNANRADLMDQEIYEIGILEDYLPEQLSESELNELITATISQLNASGMQDMGKVMGALRPQLVGKADMGQVSNQIKSLLQG